MPVGSAGAYITGLFDDRGRWQGEATQAAMVGSATADYIFWSIHVDPDGNLNYNDASIVWDGTLNKKVSAPLRDMIADARVNGAAEAVWFSIGSGGVSDYANIQAILTSGDQSKIDNLYGNLALLKGLGADGFDLDYEELLSDASNLIAELTIGLHQKLGAVITYCPFYEGVWLPALRRVFQILGRQPVQAYNLQCYSGGAFNYPPDWVATLRKNAKSIGVNNPDCFVRPILAVYGYNSMPYTPREMTRSLEAWQSMGASVWNTSWISGANAPGCQYSMSDYAQAVSTGASRWSPVLVR
jgi:hypothetical protein